MAMIAVVDADRNATQGPNTLGPQPGVVGFVGQMPGEFLLQAGVIHPVDQAQNKIGAPQLGLAIVVEQ
jgi:hypothetical protein